ncbi:hypothetical protein KL86DES1_20622 [uncultured Desulfovibrio sp.]|uniref:Uncharacterized protein n=1 Tax=uncultured Desulfovibrio sp. TaxID=167968 RepID=A0A212L4H9_9BACT|nr:hypothetical protein KL86DES1_20622 [uncultured Desulfovibrio sp.]VZH33524.1 conserved protein of unknown function [Desulfovibrio sp. 86]
MRVKRLPDGMVIDLMPCASEPAQNKAAQNKAAPRAVRESATGRQPLRGLYPQNAR